MQMINLNPDEYKERLAKILPFRNKIYFSTEIKQSEKMLMQCELRMGAFLGTNYQEQEVQRVLNELLMGIKGKLYFYQMTRPIRCTER